MDCAHLRPPLHALRTDRTSDPDMRRGGQDTKCTQDIPGAIGDFRTGEDRSTTAATTGDRLSRGDAELRDTSVSWAVSCCGSRTIVEAATLTSVVEGASDAVSSLARSRSFHVRGLRTMLSSAAAPTAKFDISACNCSGDASGSPPPSPLSLSWDRRWTGPRTPPASCSDLIAEFDSEVENTDRFSESSKGSPSGRLACGVCCGWGVCDCCGLSGVPAGVSVAAKRCGVASSAWYENGRPGGGDRNGIGCDPANKLIDGGSAAAARGVTAPLLARSSDTRSCLLVAASGDRTELACWNAVRCPAASEAWYCTVGSSCALSVCRSGRKPVSSSAWLTIARVAHPGNVRRVHQYSVWNGDSTAGRYRCGVRRGARRCAHRNAAATPRRRTAPPATAAACPDRPAGI